MDINRLWKNTQEELKIVLAPAVFQTFVSKTELISLQNNKAVLACPNSYLVDINKKRYYQIFKDALDNQTKTQNTLEFIVQEPLINPSPINSPLFEYTPKNTSFQHNLHPKFTFDTLIVGNSNKKKKKGFRT